VLTRNKQPLNLETLRIRRYIAVTRKTRSLVAVTSEMAQLKRGKKVYKGIAGAAIGGSHAFDNGGFGSH
jgi:hypothetical protein